MVDRRQRPTRALALLAVILLACVGGYLVEAQTRALHRLYDDVVLDNRNHYLPCRQLPMHAEVQQVVETHKEVIDQIEEAGGEVRIDRRTCPGETVTRADLLISYPGHRNRVAIESIINGEAFFGVPYRLLNN